MNLTVNIGSHILGGAAAGAITAAIIIAVFAVLGAVVESLRSLGGSGGFMKKFFKGCLVYVPVGIIVGGGIATTGLPWWTAILVVIVLTFVLSLIMKTQQRARRY